MSAARRPIAFRPSDLKTIACASAAWLALGLPAAAFAAPADPVLDLRAGLFTAAQTGWPPAGSATQALIDKDFDIPAITRAVLGDHASAATPAQYQRLSRAMTLRLEQVVARAPAPAPSDGFAVVSVKPAERGDWLVTTRSNPTKAGQSPILTGWRVHDSHGRLKIVDTIRGGTSIVQLQHDDFDAALQGRDLDSVINQFESRAAAKPANW
jgi:ABC-type transporter MlaC component